mmetsp:Transcript_82219/g.251243  ORF Transcript_82219/g.251243 Transcript_82219/m.251243 type:complete len:204 (+) Transcript_82219:332-943(+)
MLVPAAEDLQGLVLVVHHLLQRLERFGHVLAVAPQRHVRHVQLPPVLPHGGEGRLLVRQLRGKRRAAARVALLVLQLQTLDLVPQLGASLRQGVHFVVQFLGLLPQLCGNGLVRLGDRLELGGRASGRARRPHVFHVGQARRLVLRGGMGEDAMGRPQVVQDRARPEAAVQRRRRVRAEPEVAARRSERVSVLLAFPVLLLPL